ncbi:ubiquinol oxidase subunit II [Breoghania sp.]|uniref:ubiquinol oxidase subunit II n=1 Tax=Breoghania sp. TaxID=2065378 RepID=UPI0029CA3F3E|nr:ubiquinol oxidase subunit II [Breoghania sp.]
MSRFRALLVLPVLSLLGGCNLVILDPAGDMAMQQRDLIVLATVLMLVIVLPVMALTVWFAWRYRKGNDAPYEPDWDHSMKIELVVWAAPLAIIIALGSVTWVATHMLDPYRPLDRIAAGKPVPEESKPLEVEVVALDWKWLFFYPEYGVATVNELAAPVDRPITFRITASSVMNSFFIPALAGQIYAMPGMETKLHAVVNRAGVYDGLSANYSGAGFSGMRFKFHGMSDEAFADWIANVREKGSDLTRPVYEQLERPSENVAPIYYAGFPDDLYNRILNMCVDPAKMCMGEMMAIDREGGLGLAGIHNVLPHDKGSADAEKPSAILAPRPGYLASLCTDDDPFGLTAGFAGSASPEAPSLPATPISANSVPVTAKPANI